MSYETWNRSPRHRRSGFDWAIANSIQDGTSAQLMGRQAADAAENFTNDSRSSMHKSGAGLRPLIWCGLAAGHGLQPPRARLITVTQLTVDHQSASPPLVTFGGLILCSGAGHEL